MLSTFKGFVMGAGFGLLLSRIVGKRRTSGPLGDESRSPIWTEEERIGLLNNRDYWMAEDVASYDQLAAKVRDNLRDRRMSGRDAQAFSLGLLTAIEHLYHTRDSDTAVADPLNYTVGQILAAVYESNKVEFSHGAEEA